MQQILLARLDKIEQLEAEFAAEADADDEAEAEADLEADADADTMSAAAAGMQADAAPHTSHTGSVKSHASDMAAGASSGRQQGEGFAVHMILYGGYSMSCLLLLLHRVQYLLSLRVVLHKMMTDVVLQADMLLCYQ